MPTDGRRFLSLRRRRRCSRRGGAACGPRRAQQASEDFVFAVANDRVAEVKSLLARGIDPNGVDRNGDPALVIAAREGYVATVEALLAARAKVNARNRTATRR